MAFTGAEKAAIRNYLGYSELFHDIDTRLEGQMDTIGTTRPDAEARVRALLTKLAALETKITEAGDCFTNLKKGPEGVEFFGPEQILALQSLGATYIQQMSIIFEVSAKRAYFGVDFGSPIALG